MTPTPEPMPSPFANHASFPLSPDDASAVVAWLDGAGQSSSSGIFYEDGVLFAPPTMTPQVTVAVENIGAARKASLKAYAAMVRYNKETSGLTVAGKRYATDRETQSKLTNAVVMSQVSPSTLFQWKNVGGFVQLDAAAVVAVAQKISAHVQACFAAEQSVGAAIDAGKIVSRDQVDGHRWPPSS